MTHDTEKYLNDLRNYVLGLVPEERPYPEDDQDLAESEDIGFNAAVKKMKEKINEADFEPLIRT